MAAMRLTWLNCRGQLGTLIDGCIMNDQMTSQHNSYLIHCLNTRGTLAHSCDVRICVGCIMEALIGWRQVRQFWMVWWMQSTPTRSCSLWVCVSDDGCNPLADIAYISHQAGATVSPGPRIWTSYSWNEVQESKDYIILRLWQGQCAIWKPIRACLSMGAKGGAR